MAITVHGVPFSTCTARVLICLHEKGLQYELGPVDVRSESRATNRYIACKYRDVGSTDLLPSNSVAESAAVETWMEVEAHQFNGPISAIFHQLIVNPIYGIPTDEKIIESEPKELQKVLDVYEERLSKYEYLVGDNYTLADLNHIPFLVYLMKTPRATLITARPRVNTWWDRISAGKEAVEVVAHVTLVD